MNIQEIANNSFNSLARQYIWLTEQLLNGGHESIRFPRLLEIWNETAIKLNTFPKDMLNQRLN